MPLIPFPNVPALPGVPALARSVTVPTSATDAFGLAMEILGDLFAARWGIFNDGGARALMPDSFLEVHYKNDERQSDYPIEEGQFATFNKVNTPYDCRVKVGIASDTSGRTKFLAQCDKMLKSTDLFTVITPEASYKNASLVNYLYGRSQRNGATMIVVELWFQEVRNTAKILTPQTKQPDGADTVSDGQVQAFPVDGPGSVSAQPLQMSAVQ